MQTEEKIKSEDIRLLEILSQTFPNADSASTEIINLEAILNLPKGTEHFVADIHGEHEAFLHILRNASGNIKRKVTELFDEELTPAQISELCTLIYYPERRLEMAAEDASKTAFDAGLRKVKAYVKGPGAGRESAIRTINNAGIIVTEIIDVTPMPHNGCRPKGRRKV